MSDSGGLDTPTGMGHTGMGHTGTQRTAAPGMRSGVLSLNIRERISRRGHEVIELIAGYQHPPELRHELGQMVADAPV